MVKELRRKILLVSVLVLLMLFAVAPLISLPVNAWENEEKPKVETTDVQPAATTIFTEGFEGAWPGSWNVGDWDSRNGSDYWGAAHPPNPNFPHTGTAAAFCAEVGDHPNDRWYYDDNMNAYMVRPVSLSSYSSATLSYWYWTENEVPGGTQYDFLYVLYLSSGSWHYVDQHGGDSNGWKYSSVNIPNTALQVGFYFYSDYSNSNYFGSWVDDVVLTGTEPYMAVRGNDNQVYYRAYNTTTAAWSSWTGLPGATCDSPAAAVCGNEFHMVVRGMDGNTLWHGYKSLISGLFSGWTLLSGSTPSAPTLTSNGTALSLVVRGQNNLIYYRFYTLATLTWTDWAAVPSGATCDGPAATVLANKLHVVVRGMDGYSIWHSSVDLSTGAFSGWDLVGGATQSKPTLTTDESLNEICLVVRGLNNVIYRNAWSGSSWTGWFALPGGTTCDGPGATVTGEAFYVVVRGMDGSSLWIINLKTISGWMLLDGSTPSPPTLTS